MFQPKINPQQKALTDAINESITHANYCYQEYDCQTCHLILKLYQKAGVKFKTEQGEKPI